MPSKKKIDDLDIQILKYLQNDARRSLKKLADKLKKKTSTIYHRLQRLKSNDVILGYSIIMNPGYLDIHKIGIHTIKIKPLNISSLDATFLSSFANFIKTEFSEVLFIGISEDSQAIHLISFHSSDKALNEFLTKLKENPYIANIESQYISEIVKGQKLFSFNEHWMKASVRHRKVKRESNQDESQVMEINLDDEFQDDEDIEETDEEQNNEDFDEEIRF
ncbi:MAG: hypothetical protein DRO88_08085 [Promethearchaeia archaeon]|nr:MAG: hypothetical protein DRO88_08085 [Candidatus Lokiarchaeia archaeon]